MSGEPECHSCTGELKSHAYIVSNRRMAFVGCVAFFTLIYHIGLNFSSPMLSTVFHSITRDENFLEISPTLVQSTNSKEIFSTFYSRYDDQKIYLARNNLSDAELLVLASHAAKRKTCRDGGRIAFLFITRGDIPLEPLWQRYFEGYIELYSIYVHAAPGFKFPKNSLFSGKEIPSKDVRKLSMDLVDALRTLTAYALLDDTACNSWFVLACESTVPIRSFSLSYAYLTNSKISFVDSFHPAREWLLDGWKMEPELSRQQLRKGELWMCFQRKHAGMIVGEQYFYKKFMIDCKGASFPDEEYVQTMLSIYDPQGIANRSVMFVNWTSPHSSSPYTYNSGIITPMLIQNFQNLTLDLMGMHQDVGGGAGVQSSTCLYNGRSQSPCFLFARKFAAEAVDVLMQMPSSVLGY
ncbi:hypothetical protein O6H91_09G100800 [Diphasiastrum complanatum]|uniref:Uncharacterized protein n=1 Tax=Diphasiastrum complanatum TaxID=34168 RepID=A0ACC2CSI3_DIPCM|nr:hypothetical protein O6H91_09G100800 [Diphasiastrum complanatum]